MYFEKLNLVLKYKLWIKKTIKKKNNKIKIKYADEIEYIKLDVSNSYDPNGDDLSYSWVIGGVDEGVPNVTKSGLTPTVSAPNISPVRP